MNSYQTQAPEAPSSMSARDVLQLLWRRSPVILLILGLTAGATYYITKSTQKAWTATSQLIMLDHPTTIFGSPGLSSIAPPPESVDTQVTMIQTAAMVQKTLDWIKNHNYDAIAAGHPEHTIAMPDQNTLANSLSVVNPRNTSIIEISVDAESLQRSQDLTQAVSEAFVDWKRAIVQSNYDAALAALKIKTRLADAEQAAWQRRMIAFKQQHNMVDVAAQQADALHKYMDYDSKAREDLAEVRRLQERVTDIQHRFTKVNRQLGQSKEMRDDGVIAADQAALNKLINDRYTASLTYTDKFPGKLSNLDALITQATARRDADMAAVVSGDRPTLSMQSTLQNQLQEAEIAFDEQTTKLQQSEENRAQLHGLLHDANQINAQFERLTEQGKEIYEATSLLHTSLNSLTVAQNSASGNVEISQNAYSPPDPSRPNWIRNSLFGGVIGLLLCFMAVLLLEQSDQRLRSLKQARQLMPGPIIGTLPKLSRKQVNALMDGGTPDYEAYSIARANLGLALRSAMPDDSTGGQIVMITSALPGEGKSLTAASLARSAAKSGKAVILINADMRHPSINDLFNTDEKHGLVDVLNDTMSLEDALVSSDVENLDVLHCGQPDRNPSDLVSQPRMGEILQILRAEADLVIVDTPPCSVVADALVLAPYADCILQVVSLGMTDQNIVMDTAAALRTADPKTMVFFINRTPSERSKSYGYYYYHKEGPSAPTNGSGRTSVTTARALPNGNGNLPSQSENGHGAGHDA